MNVQGMTHEQRGIYIDMLAIAWDSEEPGIITLSEDALCHELRILKRSLRRLLAAFPACWRRERGVLIQPKLHEQWLKYQEIQQKRSSALRVKGGSASASAFAPASATANSTPTPARAPEENVFQVFWKAYPRKTNEAAAFRAWVRCTGIHDHIEEILTVIMRYETSGLWDDKSKIPSAENFIRDKRWRDEVPQNGGNLGQQNREAAERTAKKYGIERTN